MRRRRCNCQDDSEHDLHMETEQARFEIPEHEYEYWKLYG